MRNEKRVLSRLFGRRSKAELDVPNLNDLTAHLAIDLDAISSRPGEPAFMAPPDGSGPYYGFRLLPEVAVDGFVLGAITDFEQFPGLESGDAFVQAPDGSRAGLEWRISDESYLLMMASPTAERWGVWLAGFTEPMDSLAAARINLASIKPGLEERWRNWHEAHADGQFEVES